MQSDRSVAIRFQYGYKHLAFFFCSYKLRNNQLSHHYLSVDNFVLLYTLMYYLLLHLSLVSKKYPNTADTCVVHFYASLFFCLTLRFILSGSSVGPQLLQARE